MFNFNHLGTGADFDVEDYSGGFLVIRRIMNPTAVELLEQLAEALSLQEVTVTACSKSKWVRVDLRSSSPKGLVESVVEQMRAAYGEKFTVNVKHVE